MLTQPLLAMLNTAEVDMMVCYVNRRASAAAPACARAGASTRRPASQPARVVTRAAAPRPGCPELVSTGTLWTYMSAEQPCQRNNHGQESNDVHVVYVHFLFDKFCLQKLLCMMGEDMVQM